MPPGQPFVSPACSQKVGEGAFSGQYVKVGNWLPVAAFAAAWSRGGQYGNGHDFTGAGLASFEQALVEVVAVLAVVSGKKALKILSDAATTIQGIVTDKRFQEAPDGWDVARFSREVDPEMPVVYASGDGAPDWEGVSTASCSANRSISHSW